MEKFHLLPLLFQSIPEVIVLISTSLILFGYEIKDKFKKIILVGILNSFILMIIRSFFPFGFHTFLGLVILSLSLWKEFKINIIKSVVISAFGITVLGVLESVFVPVLLQVFNLNMEEVLNHQLLRIIIAYPHLFVFALIGMLAYKGNWHLINLDSVIISKSNIALIIVVMLHMLLLAFFNLAYYLYPIDIFSEILPVYNLFCAISLIMSLVLIKRLFSMAEGEALIETQKQHYKNVDDLFTSYRAQRHDFNNHLQTVYRMIAASGNKEAITYLDSLLDEFDELNELIRLKHSALAALLKAKIALAASKNIDFQFSIRASLENIKIKPHELVNILGNLIDNAVDALEGLNPANRKMGLEITYSGGFFTFKMSNFGVIEQDILDKIFENHFTTKDTTKHSGLGLSTVKKLVTKNKGEINVESSREKGTVFTFTLPAAEE